MAPTTNAHFQDTRRGVITVTFESDFGLAESTPSVPEVPERRFKPAPTEPSSAPTTTPVEVPLPDESSPTAAPEEPEQPVQPSESAAHNLESEGSA